MDASQYYITTITNAVTKIGPIVAFLVAGYFIFVKLPFWFFLKNMNITKKSFEEKLPQDFQKDYSVENYKDFQRRMKLVAPPKAEEKRKEEKKEDKKEEKKQERRKESPRPERPRPVFKEQGPEDIFGFKKGESFTKEDLKKKYYELLRMNHPDKVANLGNDFKTLAEKNTKEINKAYDKLKSKAA